MINYVELSIIQKQAGTYSEEGAHTFLYRLASSSRFKALHKQKQDDEKRLWKLY